MKKTMVFSIVAITLIIIATSFNIFGTPNVVPLPEAARPSALYVCPADAGIWTGIAKGLMPYHRFLLMFFFFGVIVLLFVWGWGLYQNLLSDKFDKKAYTNAWGFTKLVFWGGVILLILVMTPNYFRTVKIAGRTDSWVLCEETDVDRGARAVRATAVSRQ